jgi:hypothetical protein
MLKPMIMALACLCAAQAFGGIRTMPPDDPNLDPGWDWTAPSEYVLYSSVNGGTVQRYATQLPYYLPGNTLNSFQTPDMYPEDGWELVHRDFGTPGAAPPFPYARHGPSGPTTSS